MFNDNLNDFEKDLIFENKENNSVDFILSLENTLLEDPSEFTMARSVAVQKERVDNLKSKVQSGKASISDLEAQQRNERDMKIAQQKINAKKKLESDAVTGKKELMEASEEIIDRSIESIDNKIESVRKNTEIKTSNLSNTQDRYNKRLSSATSESQKENIKSLIDSVGEKIRKANEARDRNIETLQRQKENLQKQKELQSQVSNSLDREQTINKEDIEKITEDDESVRISPDLRSEKDIRSSFNLNNIEDHRNTETENISMKIKIEEFFEKYKHVFSKIQNNTLEKILRGEVVDLPTEMTENPEYEILVKKIKERMKDFLKGKLSKEKETDLMVQISYFKNLCKKYLK